MPSNPSGAATWDAIGARLAQTHPAIGRPTAPKALGMFLLLALAITASVAVISQGALLSLVPYVLGLALLGPFAQLGLSKWLAKRSHGIETIDPAQFKSAEEQSLYTLVEKLSRRAGLPTVPEVGIYESPDQNAFATGMFRSSALVAFSSGLLENMDEAGIAAVAAHEIAHIANGDMVSMTVMQSAINAMVLLLTLPLWLLRAGAWFSEDVGKWGYLLVRLGQFLITALLAFLGSLLLKAYSRHREFAADRLAARLLGPEPMASALEQLRADTAAPPPEQLAYAAFKISSAPAFMDILSTHPSLERRIARLRSSNLQAETPECPEALDPRNQRLAKALTLLTGWAGAHRFYLGSWGWGIAYLGLSFTGLSLLLWIIDGIRQFRMSPEQFHAKYDLAPVGAWSW